MIKKEMKLSFSLLCITSALFHYTEPIMYGRFISIEKAPYFVSLLDPYQQGNVHGCGGSIISEYWLITAAHCVDYTERIMCGESIKNKENSSSTYRIEKMLVHGSYSEEPLIYDIALIKLREPIRFDEKRQPIKIRKSPPRENETIILVGFGDQGDTKGYPPVLRQTVVAVVNETICNFYTDTWNIQNVVFCAGNGTTDVCPGDSGGPAVIDGQLAGLVSYGPECTMYNHHDRSEGLYTRIDTFYDWIMQITGIAYTD